MVKVRATVCVCWVITQRAEGKPALHRGAHTFQKHPLTWIHTRRHGHWLGVWQEQEGNRCGTQAESIFNNVFPLGHVLFQVSIKEATQPLLPLTKALWNQR